MTSTLESKSPPARRTSRHHRRRTEVIDAAAAVFAQKGYHGATTKDISRALGLRQGSLYYYFTSKEAALEEVCRIGIRDHLENLIKIVSSDVGAAEKVRLAIMNHLRPIRDRGDYVRVFLFSRRHLPAPVRDTLNETIHRYEELLESIFREGVERGDFHADLDCRLAVLGLLGMCNDVVTWYGKEPGQDIESIGAEYTRLMLQGITADSAVPRK